MTTKKQTKKVKKYSLQEIKSAMREMWSAYHHTDDWGLDVMYLRSAIMHINKFLTKKKNMKKG